MKKIAVQEKYFFDTYAEIIKADNVDFMQIWLSGSEYDSPIQIANSEGLEELGEESEEESESDTYIKVGGDWLGRLWNPIENYQLYDFYGIKTIEICG